MLLHCNKTRLTLACCCKMIIKYQFYYVSICWYKIKGGVTGQHKLCTEYYVCMLRVMKLRSNVCSVPDCFSLRHHKWEMILNSVINCSRHFLYSIYVFFGVHSFPFPHSLLAHPFGPEQLLGKSLWYSLHTRPGAQPVSHRTPAKLTSGPLNITLSGSLQLLT